MADPEQSYEKTLVPLSLCKTGSKVFMRFGLIQVHPVPFISYKKSRKIPLYIFFSLYYFAIVSDGKYK